MHVYTDRILDVTVLQEPFNHQDEYVLLYDRSSNKIHFKTHEMTPHIYMMSLYILFNITTYLEENKNDKPNTKNTW
jgi:hypothetical protein